MRRDAQLDLFRPQAQPDLFEAPAPVSYAPDPDKVRRKLLDILNTARGADSLPWPWEDARYWRKVFPQMCNWLPDDEAQALRDAFAAEVRRLGFEKSAES